MTEREEKLERLVERIRREPEEASPLWDRLKGEGKVKTATFRRMFGRKLVLQHSCSQMAEQTFETFRGMKILTLSWVISGIMLHIPSRVPVYEKSPLPRNKVYL